MKTGLEVFDFKEEEELVEHGAAKFLEKFKNPNIHNSLSLSREVVECVSQESDVLLQKLNDSAIMDVEATESDHNCDADDTNAPTETMEEDATESDHNCNADDTNAPKETMEENAVAEDGTSGSESNPQLGSSIHQHESHSMILNDEYRSLLTEEEARESCFAEPWSERRVLNYDPTYSPSSSAQDDEKSDDDECMNDDPPSSPAPNIAEENAVFDNITLNHHFNHNSGMDGVDIAVDYVLYRDAYLTGCLVTFSSSGIKINGSTEWGDEGIFSLQKGIDDVIRIESHHIDRMGTVNVKLCFLSKEAGQAESSGVEELEFAAVEPDWSKILDDILSVNDKYLALWNVVSDMNASTAGEAEFLQQRPYFPKFDESFEDVIYPKGDSDAVSISKRDVDLLQPETFINDTIIDFYIKYLKNQIPPEEKYRFHFFNSFFFRKLADMDKDPKSALDGRAAFLRVQKWTRKVDIFGKDYIFIPVNFNLHWSLLVICHPGEAANFKDEDADKSLKVPCILHMDSIRGTHTGLRSLVQSYLWEEWKSRQKEVSEEVSSKFLSMRFVSLELPQQENSFDCGLFLLHYLELFLVDAPVDFSPFRINDFSKFLNVDWFPPAEASLKRTLIERLIYELLENRYREVASGACNDERHSDMLENNENEKVGMEFFQERCSMAYSSHGSLTTSEAGQGIEITLLASSSMRNTQCVNNDQGLVFREFLNSGVAAGSLLAQCAPFDQSSSFYRLNCPVSQIEDDVEAGEQFVYYPPGETVFQQFNGLTTPTGSIPYSFRGIRDNNTWNSGISAQEDDTRSSAGTSTYDSDDSDVGIIENFPMAKIAPQLGNTDQEQSQSMGNSDPVTAVPASAPCEMLEACVDEGTEDPGKMQDNDNKNSSLASSQENPIPSMQEPPIMVQNGIHCHIEAAKVSGNNLQAIDNQLKSNVTDDEVQTSNDDDVPQNLNDDDENTGADHDDLQTKEEHVNTDGNDMQKAHENVTTDDTANVVQTTDEHLTSNVTGHDLESIDDGATVTCGDVQTADDKVMSNITSNDKITNNFSVDSEQTGDGEIMTNISGNDFQSVDGITTNVNGIDEQRNADSMTTDLDEQQASKRRKVTPSMEGELGPMGSLLHNLDLSNDIHL